MAMPSKCSRILVVFGMTSAIAGAVGAVERRAFVTSVVGTGDLSTWPGASGANALARADAICRARAQAGGLANAATFRAWLSTATTDAYCHVQGLSGKKSDDCGTTAPPSGGPWYNTNDTPGRPFLPTLAEVTGANGSPYSPAQFDEFGVAVDEGVASDRVWTGTLSDGSAWDDFHCANWSSSAIGESGGSGLAHASGSHWTVRGTRSCGSPSRLLCLEPGPSDPVELPWLPGVLVFVTSATGSGDLATWPEAGGATGLAAGDAICRTLAAGAHLPAPDAFVAWLSTGAIDAVDRLTTDGPFRRVDRLQVAGSVAALTDGVLNNTLHVLEDGSRLSTLRFVWTGTETDGGAEGARCGNWTDDSPGNEGAQGHAVNSGSFWTDDSGWGRACDQNRSLYCFANVLTLFWDGFDLTGDASRWSSVAP